MPAGLSISNGSLVDELRKTLTEINAQIDAAKQDVEKQSALLPLAEQVPVYKWKYTNGTYVLTDLLAAKATCLAAIASLQANYKR